MLAAMATVTFLFVDQVGSTEQLAHLGDATTGGVRDRLFEILRTAVEANEGAIVDNTGDGVMATFTGAADAVAAAISMMQGAAAHTRAHPEAELQLRVGLHTGEPMVNDEGRYFGMPIVIAARLCARAAAGEILASSIVRLLADGTATFEDAGAMELKGVGAPVATATVRWERVAAPRSLPTGLDIGDVPLVGREAAFDELRAAWREAARGSGRLALVVGQPGIGKTRLAAELAREAIDEGATILCGRCDEGLGAPYQPFVGALRQFLAVPPPGPIQTLLGSHAPELARLAPEIASIVDGAPLRSDPESERLQLFEAVTSWLRAAGRRQPLVLVVDDLHWGAESTILLVRHLAKSIVEAAVLVIVTYRDTDLDRQHPLSAALPELRRLPSVVRVALDGVGLDALQSLVEDDDGVLARRVFEETEGNPFFVGEVLRNLVEHEALVREGDSWKVLAPVAQLPIPEGVREVVGRRVSRLGDVVDETLSIAAVIGQQFDLDVLEAVSDRTDGEVLDALEAATTALLVRTVEGRTPRFRFAHAIICETLYRELSPARRARTHLRVGQTMERLHPAEVESLAHHFLAAAPADLERSTRYAEAAGGRALRGLAHETAIRYYEAGLDALDPRDAGHGSHRLRLQLGLAEAHRRVGELDEAARQFELAVALAREVDDANGLADAALGSAGWFPGAAAVGGDVPLLAEALDALPPVDSSRRARLLGSIATRTTDIDRALASAREAVAMAARLGDDVATAFALHSLHAVLMVSGPSFTEEAYELAPGLRRASIAAGEYELIGASSFSRANPACELGAYDVVREEADRLRAFGLQHRNAYFGAAADCFLAMIAHAEGRIDGAERHLGDAAQWQSKHPTTAGLMAGVTFAIARTQGNLAPLEPLVAAIVADDEQRALFGPVIGAFHALLLAELGRDEAAHAVEQALPAAARPHLSRSGTVGILAEAAIAVGDRALAEKVRSALLPWQRRVAAIPAVALIAPIDLQLAELEGLLGNVAAASARLGVAAKVVAELGIDAVPLRRRVQAAEDSLRVEDPST